ncbi:MAG: two-component system regulatory protein YycI [Lactobacillus sp.]|nr:two-component system regulatory protein YycI [Lactobacillus sp.]
MDFKRIEMIFLVVFIALDVFLFTSYIKSRNAVVITNNSGHISLAKEMDKDNIAINKKLNNHPSQGYYLASKDNQILRDNQNKLRNQSVSYNEEKHQLNSILDSPILLAAQAPQQTLNRFLAKQQNILFGNQYSYEPNLSTKNNIVYIEKRKIGQFYEFDGRINFQIEDNRLVGYQQRYIDDINVLREKQATISERHAVDSLYTNNEIPSNSQIRWIELAYGRLLKVKENTIYIPMWYVGFTTKGSKTMQISKVNAFSGAIIKEDQNRQVKVSE